MKLPRSILRHSIRQGSENGFTLLEVLISMLILAFGLLSMGGLQLASLRSNQTAAKTSAATTLVKDYSEMMRSNTTISNITSTVAGVNPYLFDTNVTSTFPTPTVICKTATCTPAEIATFHVADWAERLNAQLPGGRAVVCRDAAPRNSDGTFDWACDNSGTLVVIKLGWPDRRSSQERGTTTFALTYPQLVMTGSTGYAE